MTNSKNTRIRTIQQCLYEIRVLDAQTAVTENFIRLLCKSGRVFIRSTQEFVDNNLTNQP